jgi:hypothetical protein
MRQFVAACLVALAFAGCAKSGNQTTPATITPLQTTSAPAPTGTPCAVAGADTKRVESTKSIGNPALLRAVRNSPAGCPRVVFEFENAVPPYRVEYRDPPFANCGSGARVDTSAWGATAFLVFHATEASGADLGGAGFRQTYKGPKDIAVSSPILRRIHETCDFESVLEWVIALDARHPFKVSSAGSPPRVVIDISGTS